MYIKLWATKCFLLCVISKWISGCPVVLGSNWGNFSVILVCVAVVKNQANFKCYVL